MNLHEYQAKALLAEQGIATPRGVVCFHPLEAVVAARQLKTDKIVLKAQVHSGGRGKAGGVRILSIDEDIRSAAAEILATRLVTEQTGPEGKRVSALLVEEVVPVDREIYLSVVLDRTSRQVTIISSPEGGMTIETLAREAPEKIYSIGIHPIRGLAAYQTRQLAYCLSDSKIIAGQLAEVTAALYKIFVGYDCTLAEINPLIVSGDRVLALDAKISFDDSALYRHPELERLRDRSQEDPTELSAKQDGLSYIKLDGNIGCIVNGAGLAMATLDLISLHGGMPANFLDVGGGASEQAVTDAMNILLDDQRVTVVFINIFGGILRCDVLARGVIRALEQRGVQVPVVARLEGTNIKEGRKLFEESGLPIEMIPDLDNAARLVVEKARTC